MGDHSFRTRSSVTAPIFKTDLFNVRNGNNGNNEVAVVDDELPATNSEDHAPLRNSDDHIPPPPTIFAEDEEDDWSDVSI